MQDKFKDLVQVFEVALFVPDTAVVLATPDAEQNKAVDDLVDTFPITPVLLDVAAVLAKTWANELLAIGSRPADFEQNYMVAKDVMVSKLTERLCSELKKVPEDFQEAFYAQLRIHG